jgi:hypothetical protein
VFLRIAYVLQLERPEIITQIHSAMGFIHAIIGPEKTPSIAIPDAMIRGVFAFGYIERGASSAGRNVIMAFAGIGDGVPMCESFTHHLTPGIDIFFGALPGCTPTLIRSLTGNQDSVSLGIAKVIVDSTATVFGIIATVPNIGQTIADLQALKVVAVTIAPVCLIQLSFHTGNIKAGDIGLNRVRDRAPVVILVSVKLLSV